MKAPAGSACAPGKACKIKSNIKTPDDKTTAKKVMQPQKTLITWGACCIKQRDCANAGGGTCLGKPEGSHCEIKQCKIKPTLGPRAFEANKSGGATP